MLQSFSMHFVYFSLKIVWLHRMLITWLLLFKSWYWWIHSPSSWSWSWEGWLCMHLCQIRISPSLHSPCVVSDWVATSPSVDAQTFSSPSWLTSLPFFAHYNYTKMTHKFLANDILMIILIFGFGILFLSRCSYTWAALHSWWPVSNRKLSWWPHWWWLLNSYNCSFLQNGSLR